ncbi:MAG TPA: hydantoinase/oxoprolinase family protein [Actinomycetota bacterium]|jgi:N-methylhydantoinase A|nr:hydantoinase/oxoprolinase family protein [Actinomycetota bacterium]
MTRRIRIGIDTGGTFTDVVAFDEDSGGIATTKTPSTPADPAKGFMDGVAKVLAELGGVGGQDLTAVCHGTTVATNQLLEGKVERLGFVTTEGFEFLLEIARQSVPDGYGNSYFWVKPPRIVPADLVRTVGGRLDHRGAELRPFDDEGARSVARWFRGRGVVAIGVCFLHAYANPDHEERMRAVLEAEHPDAVVSLSSEVLREYREYERAMTTLVDAAVKPRVGRYLATIKRRLDGFVAGRPVPFYVMKSNGGVLSADEVVHQPISTVLSGPAAGALGAALVARTAGFDRVLTLDGGGTSTDVSVVLDGEPTLTTEGSVGAYPSKIPMIDVVTVGAGGGSIAWLSREGTLKVGPRSAGADPGPLCYGKGGTEPTVTDAHAVLGRIPGHLLGGEVPLDVEAAVEGLRALGARLGLGLEATAAGVLEISAWNQANALRQVTVKRGLDVRDFVMTAFGGSGPLLCCRLLDVLGVRAAVVPRDPGNLSAFGLLTVDVKNDYVQTAVSRHAQLDLDAVARTFEALEARAAKALDAEGFPREAHRHVRTADLRYFGQAFEVRVAVADGEVDRAMVDGCVDAFHDEHQRLYGYCFRDRPEQQVEWVNLRVTGVGPIRRPSLRELEPGDGDAGRARTGSRPVCFDAAAGPHDTPIFRRDRLRPGDTVGGPAVIEEYGSTLPLHPGFRAEVDRLGNLVVVRDLA